MVMPADWRPDPIKSVLGEEKVLWKIDVVSGGFFRHKTVGMLAVTNYRIVGAYKEMPLQDVEDIVILNKTQSFTYSGSTTTSSPNISHQDLKSESETTGDVAFMRNGVPDIVFRGMDDPDGIANLARAARNNILDILRSQENKNKMSNKQVVCLQCNSPNPLGSKFCNSCGYSLSRVCQKCGKANPDEASFCGQCGIPLA